MGDFFDRSAFKKRLVISTTFYTLLLVLISKWTWKLEPGSWEFFANLAIIAFFGISWGWFMWWFFNRFRKKE